MARLPLGVLLVLLTAGCVGTVDKRDPFAAFGNQSSNTYSGLRLALLPAGGTRTALHTLARAQASGGPMSRKDVDPKQVMEELNAALATRFKEVRAVESLDEAARLGFDATLSLDMSIDLTVYAPGDTTVQLAGTFISAAGESIAVLSSVGSGHVGMWGGSFGFRKAWEAVFSQFLSGLDKSTALRAFAASPRTPAAPRPAARPAPIAAVKPELAPDFTTPERAEDYAVVIGIEGYSDLPAATYAERDATAAKSFIRAMGVPERNIALLTGNRATKNGFEKTLEGWLPNNVTDKSRVFIYYSGHGAPDPKSGDAYLVPLDGDPQYLAQTGYPLKRLYAKLGELKAKSVLVALDSCFSGAGGRSVLAKGTRPLVGKVDLAVGAQGKIAVISASAGDQISGTDEENGYGLFTYSFLSGLNGGAKDAQGKVTLGSLYGFVKPRVQDGARRGNREQTPELHGGNEGLLLR
jgi:hypothetical protein